MGTTEIIVRADGNKAIGLGHVVRSLALAHMVSELAPVTFATQFPDPFISSLTGNTIQELSFPAGNYEEAFFNYVQQALTERRVVLVLDGYHFDNSFQQPFKEAGARIVYIDDHLSLQEYCDVLINPAEGITSERYPQPLKAAFYSGRKYALLRPAFLEAAKKQAAPTRDPEVLLLSFGATDPEGMTIRMLNLLQEKQQVQIIHVLTSRLNKNLEALEDHRDKHDNRVQLHFDLDETALFRLIDRSDLCITSSSTVAVEIISVGKPLICGISAANQALLYASFEQEQLCIGAGNLAETFFTASDCALLLQDFSDSALRDKLVRNQKNYIDGLSGERIREFFRTLIA